MNKIFIAPLILLISQCGQLDDKSIHTNKPENKFCDTFNLKEGRLSDFLFAIPKSSFRQTKTGIEVFEPNDTVYYDFGYKTYLAEGACIKCIVIQKESYNSYYVLDRSITDLDGSYKSDSLKGFIYKKKMYLLSYFSKGEVIADTIVISRNGSIEIRYRH